MITAARRLLRTARLFGVTSQALSIVLDRAGLRREPYQVTLRADGVKLELRPGRGDHYAFLETFALGVYREALDRLHSGETVVDIGGNVGCFAIEARRRLGASGRVVVAEPAEDCVATLRHNVQINHFTNIDVMPVAIVGRPGPVELILSDRSLFSSLYEQVDGRPSGVRRQLVDGLTVHQLFERAGIDSCALLKLDCEGAEYDIVDSLSRDLVARIGAVVLETHRIEGKSVEHLLHVMAGHGLRAVMNAHQYYYLART